MKTSSRTIRNDMMWKNWKMRILLALVIALVVYIILVLGCSGFALQGCFWYLYFCRWNIICINKLEQNVHHLHSSDLCVFCIILLSFFYSYLSSCIFLLNYYLFRISIPSSYSYLTVFWCDSSSDYLARIEERNTELP